VFTAAYLRDRLRLPGNSDSGAALYFRDKYLQKTALPTDVKRARCRYVRTESTFDELAAELGSPFVVKPANGFGAVRTAVVGSIDDFTALVAPSPRRSDVEYVAESFVDGPEMHIDGVWVQGGLRWSSVSKYHSSPLNCVQSGVLASQQVSQVHNPILFEQANHLTERVLGGLGAPDCVFHLEAFQDGEGLTFGECAIRLSGAMAPEIIDLTYGVNLYEVELSLALGEPVQDVLRPREPAAYHAYIFLRRYAGVRLTQADFEQRFPFTEIDYPDAADARVGSYGRIGHAIVSDPDDRRLWELINDIIKFNELGHG
jgi:biotin carboxylase